MATNRRHRARRRRERKRRACTSKRRYNSEIDAMRAAVRCGLTWYRCPYCHRWHLTSRLEMGRSEL